MKQCIACGRTLKPHRHGKRNHCSGRCAAFAQRQRFVAVREARREAYSSRGGGAEARDSAPRDP